MKTLLLLFSTCTLLSSCHATFNDIHLLRPRSGFPGRRLKGINCLSWRFAIETNNLRNWKVVPQSCESYVGHYLLGKQYRKDCEAVANAAIDYAKSLQLVGRGKDVWIFDIDETTLSNIPYYARSDVQFGSMPHNATKFNAWIAEGTAPAIPAMLRLYKTVQSLGIKTIFLTGTGENFGKIRIANLRRSGYRNWEKLILKGKADEGLTSVEYKSKKRGELVKQGYRIVGNIGDQWSDLLGDTVGNRTFKVPDPIYYIA